MLIRHAKDMKHYLYDVVSIKKESSGMPITIKSKGNQDKDSFKQSITGKEGNVNNLNISEEKNNDETIASVDRIKSGDANRNTYDVQKFSLRLNNDVDIKKLQRDNDRLKKVNEGLRKQFKLTKEYEPSQKEVRKLAKDILSEVGSKYPLNDLSENLTKVFKYINENGEAYSDAVVKVTSSLSRDILEEAEEVAEDEAYREIRNRLEQRTIKLSDSDIEELNQFDGYGAVRRKYFGVIKFSRSEGLGIDQIYAELSEEFPWAFDSDIVNPANQLEIIMDVVDASKIKSNSQ